MTRQPLVAKRAEELLGTSVVSTAPVAGGDIATATRLRLSSGQMALMKTLAHAPEGFFEAEAAGLRWLARGRRRRARARGARRQRRLRDPGLGRADAEAPARGGDRLRAGARRHSPGRRSDVRRLDHDGFIGRLPMPNKTCRRGPSSTPCAACCPTSSSPATAARSPRARPPRSSRSSAGSPSSSPTSRRRGCTATSGTATACGASTAPSTSSTRRPTAATARSTWRCCTSSACRTCPASCRPTTRPPRSPTAGRTGSPLHQLFPLLVHACMFGGGYGARAATVAARYA